MLSAVARVNGQRQFVCAARNASSDRLNHRSIDADCSYGRRFVAIGMAHHDPVGRVPTVGSFLEVADGPADRAAGHVTRGDEGAKLIGHPLPSRRMHGRPDCSPQGRRPE